MLYDRLHDFQLPVGYRPRPDSFAGLIPARWTGFSA